MRIELDPWIDSLTIFYPMPIWGCLPPATVGRATIDNVGSWAFLAVEFRNNYPSGGASFHLQVCRVD